MRKKKKKIDDPRDGEYSEIEDDDTWLRYDKDGQWGGDDGHTDMLNFAPADWALVLWKTDGGRERWLARADIYSLAWANEGRNNWPDDLDDPPEDHPFAVGIRERVAELDARFNRLGKVSKKR